MRVVVIGGGIVGLAAAEELTRRKVKVLLLERNESVAREASSAAAGILSPQSEAGGPGPFLDLLTAGAGRIPEEVVRLQTDTGLEIDYRPCGMVGLAFSESEEKDLERARAWQSKTGIAVEPWSARRIREEEPAVDGPVRSGLFWPDTGQLDPVPMAQAYERLILRGGGEIRTRTPVLSVRLRGNEAAGVRTPAGEIDADAVINCAGSWAGFDRDLPFQIPCVPVRGQMLQFKVRQALVRRVVHSSEAYLVQRRDGRVVAGTTVERVGYDRRVTEEGRRSIRQGAARLCSSLADLPPEAEWAGLRPDTPDHLPILGETPVRGLWVAAGHYRNGILLAPLTGRLMADCAMGKRPEISLEPFRLERFLAMAHSHTKEERP